MEQGIVKQLSERRKKKLDRLAPSIGLAKRRHNRKRALAWRKRRRGVKEKREKSIAKERTAPNTPAGDAVSLETSLEDTPPVAAPTMVVNLSECPLSSDEVQLLSRGLSFCPTPPHLNSPQVLDDLERYNRRLRLKEFFAGKEEDDARPFRPPSHWMPPKGRDEALKVYISKVRTDVEQSLAARRKYKAKDNLTAGERSALKALMAREDV